MTIRILEDIDEVIDNLRHLKVDKEQLLEVYRIIYNLELIREELEDTSLEYDEDAEALRLEDIRRLK
ncbi:MAG: hypothetical protein ACOC80_07510 [Petrotogales bacterium]